MDIKSKILVVSTLLLSTSANAALISSLDGQAYYDPVNDHAWSEDARYSFITVHDADDAMSWADANAWEFDMDAGHQDVLAKDLGPYTWADQPGNVPAAVWLFASGLLGVTAVARRKT